MKHPINSWKAHVNESHFTTILFVLNLLLLLSSCSKDGEPESKYLDPRAGENEPIRSGISIEPNVKEEGKDRIEPEDSEIESEKLAFANDLSIVATDSTSYEEIIDRVNAVKRLGERRRGEAIPILIEKLLTIRPFDSGSATDFSVSYPCASALVEIGVEAVPRLQQRFLETSSEMERLVIVDTLARIQGSDSVASWIDSLTGNGGSDFDPKRIADFKEYVFSLNIDNRIDN